jgi:hypothetical protein
MQGAFGMQKRNQSFIAMKPAQEKVECSATGLKKLELIIEVCKG